MAAATLLAAASLAGCDSTSQKASGPIDLTVWATTHADSDEGLMRIAQVKSFEEAHPGTTVELKQITDTGQDDYNDTVQAAITAGTMPDVLLVDGPNIASYAYQGGLTPLDDLLDPQVRDRMLPSLVAQGTWNGHLWAVGAFDSGLGMWGDRTALTSAGMRIPTGPDDAWTATEMADALAALATNDPDGKVIDLQLKDPSTEWITYGYSPLIYSAGAALVDPKTGLATGTLDSPDAVRALQNLYTWTAYAEPPETSDGAFTERRVALSAGGHWMYPSFHAALGDDLVLIPLPNLGNGTKSGQGSWAWVVGADTAHPAEAASLVDWFTNDAAATEIEAINGAVPGTLNSLAASDLYGPDKPLALYSEQLKRTCGDGPFTKECITVPRPLTPAYPTITAAFGAAVLAVLQGADPQQALSKAASTIDTAMELNNDYTQAPAAP